VLTHRVDTIDWQSPIDLSRRFVSDSIAPLPYTRVYSELGPHHRLRYNQLTGMFSNELILRLETGFLDRVLAAVVRRSGRDSVDADLVAALHRFRDDERSHAVLWRQLNRLSAPAWYEHADAHFLQMPAALDAAAALLTRYPLACPVVFWLQLVQEERSIEISRRCLRMPVDEIEPRYRAVYGAHVRDEVRHVRLDCQLIERFHARQSAVARRLTAAIFRWVVGRAFLRPVRSTVGIVRTLASEYPELQPLLPRMIRELGALPEDLAYHEMMYSRRTTPITFELFDAFPEFHQMRDVLLAYTPASAEGGA
jgi:hypothetical protein